MKINLTGIRSATTYNLFARLDFEGEAGRVVSLFLEGTYCAKPPLAVFFFVARNLLKGVYIGCREVEVRRCGMPFARAWKKRGWRDVAGSEE